MYQVVQQSTNRWMVCGHGSIAAKGIPSLNAAELLCYWYNTPRSFERFWSEEARNELKPLLQYETT